jgi:hypothetical protein
MKQSISDTHGGLLWNLPQQLSIFFEAGNQPRFEKRFGEGG